MSRTKHKYLKLGTCGGTNTTFYRKRRKAFRHNAKQQLNYLLDEFVNPEDRKKFKDSWTEPTDGSTVVSSNDVRHNKERYKTLGNLLHRLKK